jgi:hypothetical protein
MNIILQHMDGDLRPLDKLSMQNMQQYAQMVGADYELVTGQTISKASHRRMSKGLHAR